MEMLDLARGSKSAIWINHGLLTVAELDRCRAEGFVLTNFVRWIDPSDESAVQEAAWTIREHYPDQVLYVERI